MHTFPFSIPTPPQAARSFASPSLAPCAYAKPQAAYVQTYFRAYFRGNFRGRGFTLMEVLVALGIFGIGMIAVASVFPVGLLLQRETVYSVESQQFARNAESLVKMIGFEDDAAAWDSVDNTGSEGLFPLPTDALDAWSIDDRSYNVIAPTADRRVFWVPLVYDADDTAATAWRIYLFVVRGRDNYYFNHAGVPAADIADGNATTRDATYIPAVVRAEIRNTSSGKTLYTTPDSDAELLLVGDQIVTTDGRIYTVEAVDPVADAVTLDAALPSTLPTHYWYAHRGFDGNGGLLLTTTSFVDLIVLLDDDTQNIVRTP